MKPFSFLKRPEKDKNLALTEENLTKLQDLEKSKKRVSLRENDPPTKNSQRSGSTSTNRTQSSGDSGDSKTENNIPLSKVLEYKISPEPSISSKHSPYGSVPSTPSTSRIGNFLGRNPSINSNMNNLGNNQNQGELETRKDSGGSSPQLEDNAFSFSKWNAEIKDIIKMEIENIPFHSRSRERVEKMSDKEKKSDCYFICDSIHVIKSHPHIIGNQISQIDLNLCCVFKQTREFGMFASSKRVDKQLFAQHLIIKYFDKQNSCFIFLWSQHLEYMKTPPMKKEKMVNLINAIREMSKTIQIPKDKEDFSSFILSTETLQVQQSFLLKQWKILQAILDLTIFEENDISIEKNEKIKSFEKEILGMNQLESDIAGKGYLRNFVLSIKNSVKEKSNLAKQCEILQKMLELIHTCYYDKKIYEHKDFSILLNELRELHKITIENSKKTFSLNNYILSMEKLKIQHVSQKKKLNLSHQVSLTLDGNKNFLNKIDVLSGEKRESMTDSYLGSLDQSSQIGSTGTDRSSDGDFSDSITCTSKEESFSQEQELKGEIPLRLFKPTDNTESHISANNIPNSSNNNSRIEPLQVLKKKIRAIDPFIFFSEKEIISFEKFYDNFIEQLCRWFVGKFLYKKSPKKWIEIFQSIRSEEELKDLINLV